MTNTNSSFPASLQDALIPNIPTSMYYIHNFITSTEEDGLLAKINAAPVPHWRQLSHRRLQAHPSPLTETNTLLASPLTAWLSDPIIPRLTALGIFSASPHGKPNHCLINEYLSGQGILPHQDGPAYYPVVATVSLGSPGVLDLYATGDLQRPRWRVLQERRSLLVTTGDMYETWLHGIAGVEVDEGLDEVVNWSMVDRKDDFGGGRSVRETRVSLTFRDVLKVKTFKGLGFSGLYRR